MPQHAGRLPEDGGSGVGSGDGMAGGSCSLPAAALGRPAAVDSNYGAQQGCPGLPGPPGAAQSFRPNLRPAYISPLCLRPAPGGQHTILTALTGAGEAPREALAHPPIAPRPCSTPPPHRRPPLACQASSRTSIHAPDVSQVAGRERQDLGKVEPRERLGSRWSAQILLQCRQADRCGELSAPLIQAKSSSWTRPRCGAGCAPLCPPFCVRVKKTRLGLHRGVVTAT